MPGSVLLDLDGTLTDPRDGVLRSLRSALERVGVEDPGDACLMRAIGPPLHEFLGELLGPARARMVPEVVSLFRDRYASEGLLENRIYPGIPEALERIQRGGQRLFVCTSKPAPFAERILRHFELDRFLDRTYGADLGPGGDKTSLMRFALRDAGIRPAEAVMVGDRRHDAEAAAAHGVRMIGVLWGYGARQELLDAGCHRLVSSPLDLPDAIHQTRDMVTFLPTEGMPPDNEPNP